MANRGWLRGGQWLLAALVLAAAALLLQASRTGALVETGMQSLVPASHAVDEAELRAEAQGERLLNQQMVLLVGAPDARQAAAAAEELAQRWRASGLFAEVREKLLPDLSVRPSGSGKRSATFPSRWWHASGSSPTVEKAASYSGRGSSNPPSRRNRIPQVRPRVAQMRLSCGS